MSRHKSEERYSAFQEIVSGIRAAEAESDRLKADYEAKAVELLKKGREKSAEISAAYEKKAAEAKNRILSSGRHKTEKMAGEIVADAKKLAGGLRAGKLDKNGLEAVFESFVSLL